MHVPNPGSDPRHDDDAEGDDIPQPPVPPDRTDDVVPVEEPPNPGANPPQIVRSFE
jgi:hypothetical protein